MINKLIILNLLIIIVFCDLKFVVEIFRHGARGSDAKFYDGPGQSMELSQTGQRQQYKLGQQLRKEYIEDKQFLNSTYNYTEMYVRSDDVDRTLQSAYCQLNGMFPIGSGPDLPKDLESKYTLPPYKGIEYIDYGEQALQYNLRPTPVHSMKESDDLVLNPYEGCNDLYELIALEIASRAPILAKLTQEFKVTLEETQKMINHKTPLNIIDLSEIYDVLIADLYNGHKMPEGFSEDSELWKNITFIASYQGQFMFQSEVITKLINTHYYQYMQNVLM